jgi:divalent metal cation (Fe/Co/Zn/Cd) transporter
MTSLGRDVTADEKELVDSVRTLATGEPDVLDCHEVMITSLDGGLAVLAHVHARGTLPLSRIHDAADRIEKSILASHPDITSVTIHFEPEERA